MVRIKTNIVEEVTNTGYTVHLGYNAIDGTSIKPHYNRGRSITEVRIGRLEVYGVLVGLKQKSYYNRDRSISEGTITEVDCIYFWGNLPSFPDRCTKPTSQS